MRSSCSTVAFILSIVFPLFAFITISHFQAHVIFGIILMRTPCSCTTFIFFLIIPLFAPIFACHQANICTFIERTLFSPSSNVALTTRRILALVLILVLFLVLLLFLILILRFLLFLFLSSLLLFVLLDFLVNVVSFLVIAQPYTFINFFG